MKKKGQSDFLPAPANVFPAPRNEAQPGGNSSSRAPFRLRSDEGQAGHIIVNADDWGRDQRTTASILDCFLRGTISSVSAMVFMEDSERAAELARHHRIDAGLHLNLTTQFSAATCPARLAESQQKLARYLLDWHPLSRIVFHPGLVRSFEYVVSAQIDEFRRLYQKQPDRIDGHHHMHLCANVLLSGLLPAGTAVRPHFSSEPGEKFLRNTVFRKLTHRMLIRHHRVVDFFFPLGPLEPSHRLKRIFALAAQFNVEVETHPANPEEHLFLAGGEIFRSTGVLAVAAHYAVPGCAPQKQC